MISTLLGQTMNFLIFEKTDGIWNINRNIELKIIHFLLKIYLYL